MFTYNVTMKFRNGDVATTAFQADDAEGAQELAIDACDEIGIASGTILSIRRI